LAGPIEKAGIRVVSLEAQSPLGAIAAFGKLVALLRSERPDVLQTWFYYPDYLGTQAARFASVPVLFWNVRCAFQRREEQTRFVWWVIGQLVKMSRVPDAIVSNSQAGITTHEAHGYRARKWVLIPNGFPLPDVSSGREARPALAREIGVPEDAPWVGLVARYHQVKDHPTFLRAAALLSERHPQTQFLLVGRGVDAENAELASLLRE